VRRVVSRGRTYWYVAEKIKRMNGKVVEIKIRRATDEEVESWINAHPRHAVIENEEKKASGIREPRLHPISYIC
jgi:hypothetical protein